MENKKFEFTLKIDHNIICQRYFRIECDEPNTSSLNGYMDGFCDDFMEELKLKNAKHPRINDEYGEHYTIEVTSEDGVYFQRALPAYQFHPSVRYNVDIRPKIKQLLKDLTSLLKS